MKGILLKDWAIIKRTGWLYFAIIAFMGFVAGTKSAAYNLFYAIMLPIGIIGYDERSRFERLMVMLPIRRTQMVWDKYLLAYLCMAVAVVCGIGGEWIQRGVFVFPASLLVGLGVCLISQAITFPLIFRFGIERGRLIYIASISVQAGALAAIESLRKLDAAMTPTYGLATVVLMLSLAANVGSIFLSARVYEKRLTA